MSDRRAIPGVDAVLQTTAVAGLLAVYGRSMVLEAVREVLAGLRSGTLKGEPVLEVSVIGREVQQTLESWFKPTLVPVINATGVILHTNLGRALLSKAAVQAVAETAASYSTVEFDLEKGARGSRSTHVEQLLLRLTGAEAALVVNNNAGAVLLALSALAHRKRAVISRSQLVEIGGGFRVPEVMSQSGARLVEVGTTNRVHLSDYEAALQEPAALLVRAHHSNFRITGFTSEVSLEEMVPLARKYNTLVLDDLGSGALLDTARFGMAHEPTVQDSIAAGVDVVCFSGDKLLGGPQAGILLGRKVLIDKIRRHPLARAVRADKLCLAALAATIRHYLLGEAEREIPVWQMIACPPQAIRERAQRWADVLQKGQVIPGLSTVGGGSLPEETLPTFLLALAPPGLNRFLARLRSQRPPVIARLENEQAVFDPRTVLPEQEELLLAGLQKALKK